MQYSPRLETSLETRRETKDQTRDYKIDQELRSRNQDLEYRTQLRHHMRLRFCMYDPTRLLSKLRTRLGTKDQTRDPPHPCIIVGQNPPPTRGKNKRRRGKASWRPYKVQEIPFPKREFEIFNDFCRFSTIFPNFDIISKNIAPSQLGLRYGHKN